MRRSLPLLLLPLLFSASALAQPMGPSPGGMPIAVDFKKVPVGSWAEYKVSIGDMSLKARWALVGRDAKSNTLETVMEGGPMAMMGGKMTMKMVLAGDPMAEDKPVKQVVMQMTGKDPMEMPLNMPNMPQQKFQKPDPNKLVGKETIKVPGGSFKVSHYRDQPGAGTAEFWVSEEVGPLGIVKTTTTPKPGAVGPGGMPMPAVSMELTAHGKGAKPTVTKPAKPFDPSAFGPMGGGGHPVALPPALAAPRPVPAVLPRELAALRPAPAPRRPGSPRRRSSGRAHATRRRTRSGGSWPLGSAAKVKVVPSAAAGTISTTTVTSSMTVPACSQRRHHSRSGAAWPKQVGQATRIETSMQAAPPAAASPAVSSSSTTPLSSRRAAARVTSASSGPHRRSMGRARGPAASARVRQLMRPPAATCSPVVEGAAAPPGGGGARPPGRRRRAGRRPRGRPDPRGCGRRRRCAGRSRWTARLRGRGDAGAPAGGTPGAARPGWRHASRPGRRRGPRAP
jgi:hypothetical protein